MQTRPHMETDHLKSSHFNISRLRIQSTRFLLQCECVYFRYITAIMMTLVRLPLPARCPGYIYHGPRNCQLVSRSHAKSTLQLQATKPLCDPLLKVTGRPMSLKNSRTYSTEKPVSFETILSEDNKQLTQQRLQTLYPSGRQIDNLKKVKRKAAILIPLCRVNGQPSILFTLRSSRLKAHRGEVSFPGGNVDPTDNDLQHTALRETEEELGIPSDKVDVWGEMRTVPGKNYKIMVTPFLGDLGEVDVNTLKFNKSEVAEVFTRTIESLCKPENTHFTRFRTGAGYTLPVFTGGTQRIWGLTAIVLHMTLTAMLPLNLYTSKVKHR